MSHLQELIEDLCPDGVEHRPLGELGEFLRGRGIQKADLTESGRPAIHYGQVHTVYGIWTTLTRSFVSPQLADRSQTANVGDIVLATTSEDDEAVGKATAWLGEGPAAVSSDALIYRHVLNPKYASYFLSSESFRSQKQRYITGTKVRRLSATSMAKILIPVPPIEVQREIVRILDTFSALEAELEAELEARRIQYAHYRTVALHGLRNAGVGLVALRDMGTWYGGGTPSKGRPDFWQNGTIPWISPKDMGRSKIEATEDYITETAIAQSSTRLIPAGAVAIVVRSSILDHTLPIAHVKVPAALNQDMKAIATHDGVSPRYVLHALRASSPTILRTVRRQGGSVASLQTKKLMDFKIPLPDLSEQERIGSVLDNLDSLTNDLSIGLPAELEARRKQYAYYRDKLLTFEEKV